MCRKREGEREIGRLCVEFRNSLGRVRKVLGSVGMCASRKRSTFTSDPHAFVSRGILVALFNGNVETARAQDAHLRGLISNPERAKANGRRSLTEVVEAGKLVGALDRLPSCLLACLPPRFPA